MIFREASPNNGLVQLQSPNVSSVDVENLLATVTDKSPPHPVIIEESQVIVQNEVKIVHKEKEKKKKSTIKRTSRTTKKAVSDEPLYLRSGVYNFEPKWGFNGDEKYIVAVPNIKIPIKWDRRIVFPRGMLQHIYDDSSPVVDHMEDPPSLGPTKAD